MEVYTASGFFAVGLPVGAGVTGIVAQIADAIVAIRVFEAADAGVVIGVADVVSVAIVGGEASDTLIVVGVADVSTRTTGDGVAIDSIVADIGDRPTLGNLIAADGGVIAHLNAITGAALALVRAGAFISTGSTIIVVGIGVGADPLSFAGGLVGPRTGHGAVAAGAIEDGVRDIRCAGSSAGSAVVEVGVGVGAQALIGTEVEAAVVTFIITSCGRADGARSGDRGLIIAIIIAALAMLEVDVEIDAGSTAIHSVSGAIVGAISGAVTYLDVVTDIIATATMVGGVHIDADPVAAGISGDAFAVAGSIALLIIGTRATAFAAVVIVGEQVSAEVFGHAIGGILIITFYGAAPFDTLHTGSVHRTGITTGSAMIEVCV